MCLCSLVEDWCSEVETLRCRTMQAVPPSSCPMTAMDKHELDAAQCMRCRCTSAFLPNEGEDAARTKVEPLATCLRCSRSRAVPVTVPAGDPTQSRHGRGLYSSSEGGSARAKQEAHARRANRRAHRSITRLPAHCRLHRPSRQLRHASGRRLAGVGESSRQRLAGGPEQRRRLAAVAAFFREADLEFLDALRDPSRTSLSASAFATAARVAEEYKLGSWVRANNLDGTAIRTPRLIAEYQRRLAEQPPPVLLSSVPWTENSTGRNWAFRWRRSQGAMFGKLRIEADVTLPEKRQKAGGCVVTQWSSCFSDAGEFPKNTCHRCRFWEQKGTPFGEIVVSTFWPLFSLHLR